MGWREIKKKTRGAGKEENRDRDEYGDRRKEREI